MMVLMMSTSMMVVDGDDGVWQGHTAVHWAVVCGQLDLLEVGID